jgi:hypothetical protein
MVAYTEILTAESKVRKLCARRAIGVEIDGYRYDTSDRRSLWANRAGEAQILPCAARLHACSPVHLLLSPFCRRSRPTRDPIGYQGGIKLYGYVNSSPVGAVDASGRLTEADCEAELNACVSDCWNRRPPYPFRRDKGYYQYCEETCNKEYLECLGLIEPPECPPPDSATDAAGEAGEAAAAGADDLAVGDAIVDVLIGLALL